MENELRYNSPEEVLERMTSSGWDRDKVIEILKEEVDDYDGPEDGAGGDGSPLTVLTQHKRVFVLAGVVVLGLLVGGLAAQYSPSDLFGPSTDTGDGTQAPLTGDNTTDATDDGDGNASDDDSNSAALSTDPPESVFQRSTPVDVVASDQLLAYWPLDEYRTGSTPDMSGNGYHLRFWDSNESTESPSIATGRHGMAIDLCKGCWGQTVTNPAGLNRTTMTITFWFQPGTANHTDEEDTDILHAKVYNGSWPNYRIGGADTTISDPAQGWTNLYIRRFSSSGAFSVETEQELFDPDRWHHATVEFDGSTVSVYVDGVKDTERTYNGTAPLENGIDEFQIGGSAFNGKLDELRIYQGTLSTDQIQTVMNGE